MKIKTYLTLIFCSILITSCESSRLKKEAKKQTKEFFSSLKNDKTLKAVEIYPGFVNFSSYYKSDSINVNSVNYTDTLITVRLQNYYTNGFGKLSTEDMKFYFKKDSDNHLHLFDSKGLAGLKKEDKYTFGVSTGCINLLRDTTDQKILIGLKKAEALLSDKALDLYIKLKTKVKVKTWSWSTGYGDYASGKGIVQNNSDFTIPNLKYKITYETRSGSTITSDDGYVSYDDLAPGESKSFTFYTSYVGNASTASIELIFDESLITKYLEQKIWTGNEWKQYLQSHPWENGKY